MNRDAVQNLARLILIRLHELFVLQLRALAACGGLEGHFVETATEKKTRRQSEAARRDNYCF